VSAVLVVGLGLTGQAVVRALGPGGDVTVVADDPPTRAAVDQAGALGAEVVVAPDPPTLARLVGASAMVVPSPGVPVAHPVFALADAAAVPVVSEIELAARSIQDQRESGPTLVAITGTNGKTTVTTLVTDILRAAGIDAVAAGNIGVPLIEAAMRPVEVIVAEVSSFQLQFTQQFRPSVSCWLNLAPDHLDWHPTHAHYADAKSRIWANQGVGDTTVINADDAAVVEAARRLPDGVRVQQFSRRRPADFWVSNDALMGPGAHELMPLAELPRALPHDQANALAAAAVALAAGATASACRLALASAPLLPHRVSLVAEADGVRWYDDSKATTPASVQAATAGFDSVVLIAGGRNKGLDLRVLAETVPPVRAVVAIGEAAGEITQAFAGTVALRTASSMEAAVAAAGELARPGDAVLLSPGCTSFDWYSSYGSRGDHFTSLVRMHLGKEERLC
jgi:UDP-N-acetylmuramoylalanine--D-glutamate ligase